MSEEFLHFVWQHKLYYPDKLNTVDGLSLEIIEPGLHNADSGPDFFNAKLKIDGTLWAGNIEIHIRESEWYKHEHHLDPSYDNVILHVVAEASSGTFNSKGRAIPVWPIRFTDSLTSHYQSLFFNDKWIPCQGKLKGIEDIYLNQWIERLLIERLEEKSALIMRLLDTVRNDWDQVFFILLARSFGFGVNSLPFELMARQTPLKTLLKHADKPFQLEALLLGQAGFLTSPSHPDDYTLSLQNEYRFLKVKYHLKPIDAHLWKFLRLRPMNFPTVRIAQLANLIHQSRGIFTSFEKCMDEALDSSFLDIRASDYWNNHYRPGRRSPKSLSKKLGRSSRQIILYNTIYPYLFVYYGKQNNQSQREKIIDQLYHLPAEQNSITRQWVETGLSVTNEAEAQALIFLKNRYCNHKKCLNCHIGHKVLSQT